MLWHVILESRALMVLHQVQRRTIDDLCLNVLWVVRYANHLLVSMVSSALVLLLAQEVECLSCYCCLNCYCCRNRQAELEGVTEPSLPLFRMQARVAQNPRE